MHVEELQAIVPHMLTGTFERCAPVGKDARVRPLPMVKGCPLVSGGTLTVVTGELGVLVGTVVVAGELGDVVAGELGVLVGTVATVVADDLGAVVAVVVAGELGDVVAGELGALVGVVATVVAVVVAGELGALVGVVATVVVAAGELVGVTVPVPPPEGSVPDVEEVTSMASGRVS